MKNILVVSCLSLSLFASNDYMPVSELSDNKKREYNFINKTNLDKPLGTEIYKSVSPKTNEIIQPIEEVEKKETKVDILQDVEKKEEDLQKIRKVDISENVEKIQEVKQNTKVENKTFVKEYKNENILKDEVKYSDNSFSKDFSATPKLSYMHLTLSDEDEKIGKTHLLLPEIAFRYKNHILKADYIGVGIKYNNVYLLNDYKIDIDWYRLAYLYNYLNANIGIGYNDIRIKGSFLGMTEKDSTQFPTLEVHAKNKQNRIVAEYGGFYGKNDSDIENAYEYYLNLGYEVLNNDKLVFMLGYKNRTIEFDDGSELEYKGPTLGISSTF